MSFTNRQQLSHVDGLVVIILVNRENSSCAITFHFFPIIFKNGVLVECLKSYTASYCLSRKMVFFTQFLQGRGAALCNSLLSKIPLPDHLLPVGFLEKVAAPSSGLRRSIESLASAKGVGFSSEAAEKLLSSAIHLSSPKTYTMKISQTKKL